MMLCGIHQIVSLPFIVPTVEHFISSHQQSLRVASLSQSEQEEDAEETDEEEQTIMDPDDKVMRNTVQSELFVAPYWRAVRDSNSSEQYRFSIRVTE